MWAWGQDLHKPWGAGQSALRTRGILLAGGGGCGIPGRGTLDRKPEWRLAQEGSRRGLGQAQRLRPGGDPALRCANRRRESIWRRGISGPASRGRQRPPGKARAGPTLAPERIAPGGLQVPPRAGLPGPARSEGRLPQELRDPARGPGIPGSSGFLEGAGGAPGPAPPPGSALGAGGGCLSGGAARALARPTRPYEPKIGLWGAARPDPQTPRAHERPAGLGQAGPEGRPGAGRSPGRGGRGRAPSSSSPSPRPPSFVSAAGRGAGPEAFVARAERGRAPGRSRVGTPGAERGPGMS